MWEYIEERVIKCAEYIVATGCTVRACSAHFSISKSTVHKDVSKRLKTINPVLYTQVKKVLEHNKAQRHIRGGIATREKYLSKIEISAPKEQMDTFYSCMYRTFLYPHKAYEPDENGKPIHYSPSADKVLPGVRYTDNGFWDTYRTNYPFYSIIAKDILPEIIEGYIQDYKDGGWLPRWAAGDAKNCMPSTAIDAVIADVATRNLISRDLLETAFKGMEHHANKSSTVPAYGREGCEEYLKLGYVPYDKYSESVNLTLDAAYFDDCVATVADILGYTDKRDMYRARTKNYKNIFVPMNIK